MHIKSVLICTKDSLFLNKKKYETVRTENGYHPQQKTSQSNALDKNPVFIECTVYIIYQHNKNYIQKNIFFPFSEADQYFLYIQC